MVFFNYSTMQMAAKVVYYGPGLCGKTTNLHYIYAHTTQDSRGEMVSLETETDRTLFFDLLPLDVGSIAGFNTRIQLYTVPGQVFYNTTRKLVLKGVDGVVFVADSQRAMLQANIDSFRNLEENLAEMGQPLAGMPMVLQFNKRDLSDICTIDELNQTLNRYDSPYFEASALTGQGVFETLKGISKFTLLALKKRLGRSGAEPRTNLAGAPRLFSTAPGAPPSPSPSPIPSPSPSPSAGQGPGASNQSQGPAVSDQSPPSSQAPPPPAVAASPDPAPAAAAAADVSAAASADDRPAVASTESRSTEEAPQGTPDGDRPSAAEQPAAAGDAAKAPASAPSPPAPAAAAGRTAGGGKTRSVDVLGELEKLRREAMRPAAPLSPAAPANQADRPERPRAGARSATAVARDNGRAELSRSIEMTLKRADFERARRFLVSFQVEDDQHRVVDAVRNLQVEIKDAAGLEKLLLRLNIALHARE